jgi:hypothetical protein
MFVFYCIYFFLCHGQSRYQCSNPFFVLFYTTLAISLREYSSRTQNRIPDLFTLLFKYHQEAFWIVHQARSSAFGKQGMRMACSLGAQKQGQDAEKLLEAFVQS